MSKHFDVFCSLEQHCRLSLTNAVARNPEKRSTSASSIGHAHRSEINSLVDQLYLLPHAPVPRVLAFVALEPGSDAGWICTETARILAKKIHNTVCLVDAAVQSQDLDEELPSQDRNAAIHTPARSLIETQRRDLDVAEIHTNAFLSEELDDTSIQQHQTDTINERIHKLRNSFDFVLYHTPSVIDWSEDIGLAEITDGIVLVLTANKTNKRYARQTKQILEGNGARVLGAVLTRYNDPVPPSIAQFL